MEVIRRIVIRSRALTDSLQNKRFRNKRVLLEKNDCLQEHLDQNRKQTNQKKMGWVPFRKRLTNEVPKQLNVVLENGAMLEELFQQLSAQNKINMSKDK